MVRNSITLLGISKQTKEMASEYNYGQMELDMKECGKQENVKE